LVAHIRHPRCDTIPNGEAHRVANQDDGHHGFAGEVFVAVDAVRNRELKADCVGECDDAHGEDTAEPVNGVCGTWEIVRQIM